MWRAVIIPRGLQPSPWGWQPQQGGTWQDEIWKQFDLRCSCTGYFHWQLLFHWVTPIANSPSNCRPSDFTSLHYIVHDPPPPAPRSPGAEFCQLSGLQREREAGKSHFMNFSSLICYSGFNLIYFDIWRHNATASLLLSIDSWYTTKVSLQAIDSFLFLTCSTYTLINSLYFYRLISNLYRQISRALLALLQLENFEAKYTARVHCIPLLMYSE